MRFQNMWPGIARNYCDNNMFGGEDLIRRLALVGKRAAQPIRSLRAQGAEFLSSSEDRDTVAR